MGTANDLAEANEDAIHRIDTVPPPDGEDDAYSAETKVGPLSRAMVQELMDAAEIGANAPVTIPPASGMRARPAKLAPVIPPPPRVPQVIPLPAPTPAPPQPPASAAVAVVLGALVATATATLWWLFL